MDITACATGRRSAGNYDIRSRQSLLISERIKPQLENLHKLGITRCISGGAIGYDLIFFYTVHALKKSGVLNVKNILALPFNKQSGRWSEGWQHWYSRARELADEVILVDSIPQYKTKNHYQSYTKRDYYMVDNSHYVLAGWDGVQKGGTWLTIQYAMKMNRDIIYVDIL